MAENNISQNEVRSMQEEAINRVREMQRRAREQLRQSNEAAFGMAVQPQPSFAYPPVQPPTHPPVAPPPQPRAPVQPQTHAHPPAPPPPFFGNMPLFLPHGDATAPNGSPHNFNPIAFLQKMDPEKLILIMLLLLFLNEGADMKLILALCYLLF